MTARPDVLVIGAGVNGLTAAALLAKAGRQVLVLERRECIGGLAASETFHPGYRTAGVLHDTTGLREGVVDVLELARHGLVRGPEPAPFWTPAEPGAGFLVHHDAARTADSLGSRAPKDAEAYRRFRAFTDDVRGVVQRVMDAPPPDRAAASAGSLSLLGTAVAFRRLGRKTMMEILRVAPMCVADWMNEHFETETLKTALALPAVASTFAGPWSPGTAANLLLHECAAAGSVTGGPAAVVRALEAAARAQGVTIRTGAAVDTLEIGSGAVTGVRLAGGEVIPAKTVAASCDPRHTFLDLVPSREIPYRVEHGIRNYRGSGLAAAVHLAVRGGVEFSGARGEAVAFARLGGATLDAMERTFDPVKYNRLPDTLTLDAYVPTVEEPSLAPDGCSVVSVLAYFVPYSLHGGWNEAARAAVGDQVVALLATHLPGLSDRVVAREVLAPPDLEARYGVVQGHLHHGDHALDQLLFRPIPECAQYRTPIHGLYLCGSGSHPGGGVTGAPGALAAKAILG